MVIALPMCGYTVYQLIDNFPEEAERDNLYRKYEILIQDIDDAVANAESLLSLGAALEQIDYPAGTIHVGIWQDENVLNIIEAPTSGTKGSLVVNGAGYGHIGSRKFWIIQHDISRFEQDHITIFIERNQ